MMLRSYNIEFGLALNFSCTPPTRKKHMFAAQFDRFGAPAVLFIGMVIGAGRPDSHAFIAAVGATAITYGPGLAERLDELGVARVDRALDAAGAGSLAQLIASTGDPAHVLTIADFSAAKQGVQLSMGELAGEASGYHGLEQAAQLWEKGRFHIPLRDTFPLDRIQEAHTAAAERPRQGKVALTIG
jgi:NADPH:quinone reductase-like Zn-dependent oxidoreductase